MIDCNITANYFAEKARLTKKPKRQVCQLDCDDCPLYTKNNGTGVSCESFEMHYPEQAIEVVQKWSDEHPQKTYLRRGRKKMSKKSLGYLTVITLVIIAVIVAVVVVPVMNFTNDHQYTITITDKERVTTQSDKDNISSKYLIYGEDENGKTYVFEDTDTLFRGKFNSSDVYGALKEGETYELTVIGFRIHILNWYENIIDFKEVK